MTHADRLRAAAKLPQDHTVSRDLLIEVADELDRLARRASAPHRRNRSVASVLTEESRTVELVEVELTRWDLRHLGDALEAGTPVGPGTTGRLLPQVEAILDEIRKGDR